MDSCHKIDYGLYALEILAQYHNVSVNPEEIKHRFDTDGTGLGLTSWLLAAKSLELKVKQVKKTIDRLNFIPLPALVWREDGRHFILTKVSKEANRYLILIWSSEIPVFSNSLSLRRYIRGILFLLLPVLLLPGNWQNLTLPGLSLPL